MSSEILRSHQATLLAGDSGEKNGALKSLRGNRSCSLDESGDARSVVHRAVVDLVTIDRSTDTEVVQVGREDNGFRSSSRQHSDDVFASCGSDAEYCLGSNLGFQRESRQRSIVAVKLEQLLRSLTGTLEK